MTIAGMAAMKLDAVSNSDMSSVLSLVWLYFMRASCWTFGHSHHDDEVRGLCTYKILIAKFELENWQLSCSFKSDEKQLRNSVFFLKYSASLCEKQLMQ